MARFLQACPAERRLRRGAGFDGEQALSKGLSGGMDLMVLDVMLRRDGFDVIRNLRPAKQMLPRSWSPLATPCLTS